MRLENMPGEYAFRALIRHSDGSWLLSQTYFLSVDEVKSYIEHYEPGVKRDFKFPVEVNEDGIIYCPDEKEFN